MSSTISLRALAIEVGSTIRRPEAVALKWQEQSPRRFSAVIVLLLLNAALGLAGYGLTMQLHQDASAMLQAAFLTPLAAVCPVALHRIAEALGHIF